jgi:pimeloyl-ACP methyl ester carboxylesterase
MSSRKKSTIVRAYRSTKQGLVRLAFRTLDRVAPALAVRWAVRIWATPPHPRRVPPSPAPPGDRSTHTTPGGARIAVESWGEPGRPVTYLLHGWGGWRQQLAGLVAPLVAAGHRVVTLDAPGHGEAGPGRLGGRRTHLQEVAEALATVVKETGPADAIVGHSGGANATALAIQDGLPARRLVFLAPIADPVWYARMYADLLGLGERNRHRFLRRTERLIGRRLTDFDLPARARAAAPGELPPLLVIHDRADREVPHTDGAAIAHAWPEARLHSTEGLGHRRIVADPDVIAATVSFLTAGTAAGSSPRS